MAANCVRDANRWTGREYGVWQTLCQSPRDPGQITQWFQHWSNLAGLGARKTTRKTLKPFAASESQSA